MMDREYLPTTSASDTFVQEMRMVNFDAVSRAMRDAQRDHQRAIAAALVAPTPNPEPPMATALVEEHPFGIRINNRALDVRGASLYTVAVPSLPSHWSLGGDSYIAPTQHHYEFVFTVRIADIGGLMPDDALPLHGVIAHTIQGWLRRQSLRIVVPETNPVHGIEAFEGVWDVTTVEIPGGGLFRVTCRSNAILTRGRRVRAREAHRIVSLGEWVRKHRHVRLRAIEYIDGAEHKPYLGIQLHPTERKLLVGAVVRFHDYPAKPGWFVARAIEDLGDGWYTMEYVEKPRDTEGEYVPVREDEV